VFLELRDCVPFVLLLGILGVDIPAELEGRLLVELSDVEFNLSVLLHIILVLF